MAGDKGAKNAKGAEKKKAILITGARGGFAQLISRHLDDEYEVVGVDPRPLQANHGFYGEFHCIDYRQRRMAELFRAKKFHALIHMGRVPIAAKVRKTQRFNTNVLGTRSLLDLCLRYQVGTAIVLSTFHVYGAHQHNHLYITEEDALLASHTFPEIADAVELDNVSVAFCLKHQAETRTVILRPANVIGTHLNNQISQFLRSNVCPILMGYDPMQQFVHESDMARAVEFALKGDGSGVYNVAGEGVIPFSHAIELAGATPVPIPAFLSGPAAAAMNFIGFHVPKHLIDYFKFPVVISDKAFRKDFGYAPSMSTADAIRSLRGESLPGK